MRSRAALATIASFAVCQSLGATETDTLLEGDTDRSETKWEFSSSTFTYLAQHARDYANPNFTADRDWLHLEARYNYEELKTGSVWVGWNFSTGKKLQLEITPMLGGVFGDITGVAPGYTITMRYKPFELSTQGEYFFDAGTSSGNFFYSWSELSAWLTDWLRLGAVVERTKASGFSPDVRRGPLVGFKYREVELTTYWFPPVRTKRLLFLV